jgi:hypothetical protein
MIDPGLTNIASLLNVPGGELALPMALGGLGVGVGAGLVWLAWKLWAPAKREAPRGEDQAIAKQTQELRRVARDARELTRILARELDTRAEKLTKLMERGPDAPEPARKPMPARDEALAEVVVRPDAARDLLDPSHAEIHELSDRGLSAVEIAKRLGRPPGQVELILALRKVATRG